MNVKALLAFLCLAVSGSGCIIVDGGGGGDPDPCCSTPDPGRPQPQPQARSGNVTMRWTFAHKGGDRCADVPEVKSIRISIPGEKLHNGGVYACNTAGTDGIMLLDFRGGTYRYTLEAVGYDGQVLYTANGDFSVDGNTSVDVNLTPKGSASSFAYVSWSFEGNTNHSNPNCAQAGVNFVEVRIDNGPWARLGCEEGIGSNQIESPFLEPGTHTIEFVGLKVTNDGATPYYYRSGTLTTKANAPISVSYNLWAVGGMALRWELLDGSLKKTCEQAGVTGMRINMKDRATGKLVYGEEGDAQSCTAAPILYKYLRPGQYEVFVRAMKGSEVLYTNEGSTTTLTVTAFVQKKDSDAYTLNLRR
ncbi:MAG: hypothetical protein ABW123_05990 [Cystobacter sp.]